MSASAGSASAARSDRVISARGSHAHRRAAQGSAAPIIHAERLFAGAVDARGRRTRLIRNAYRNYAKSAQVEVERVMKSALNGWSGFSVSFSLIGVGLALALPSAACGGRAEPRLRAHERRRNRQLPRHVEGSGAKSEDSGRRSWSPGRLGSSRQQQRWQQLGKHEQLRRRERSSGAGSSSSGSSSGTVSGSSSGPVSTTITCGTTTCDSTTQECCVGIGGGGGGIGGTSESCVAIGQCQGVSALVHQLRELHERRGVLREPRWRAAVSGTCTAQCAGLGGGGEARRQRSALRIRLRGALMVSSAR